MKYIFESIFFFILIISSLFTIILFLKIYIEGPQSAHYAIDKISHILSNTKIEQPKKIIIYIEKEK